MAKLEKKVTREQLKKALVEHLEKDYSVGSFIITKIMHRDSTKGTLRKELNGRLSDIHPTWFKQIVRELCEEGVLFHIGGLKYCTLEAKPNQKKKKAKK